MQEVSYSGDRLASVDSDRRNAVSKASRPESRPERCELLTEVLVVQLLRLEQPLRCFSN